MPRLESCCRWPYRCCRGDGRSVPCAGKRCDRTHLHEIVVCTFLLGKHLREKLALKVLVEHVLAPVSQQVDVEERVILGRGLPVELLQDLARVHARELVQESVQCCAIAHSKAEQVAGLGPHGRTQSSEALAQTAAGDAHVPALQEHLVDEVPVVVELGVVGQVIDQQTGRVQVLAPCFVERRIDPTVRLHQLGQTSLVVVVKDRLLVGPATPGSCPRRGLCPSWPDKQFTCRAMPRE